MCDVLILADVFEKFRKTCITYYKLDPANNMTTPSVAWDAMLLNTKVKLELLHDLDMLNVIEKMKRGGLCVGSKLYVKANNQHMGKDYDPNQPSNYIIYEGANNLYGCSMSEYLPHKDLKFNNNVELAAVPKPPDENETGYIY